VPRSNHKFWLVPVEFRSSDWQSSAHLFKHTFLQSFVHIFNSFLVPTFKCIDLKTNSWAIGCCQSNWIESFAQIELNVSVLKVVIVDANTATQWTVLSINSPLWLPFSTPVLAQT